MEKIYQTVKRICKYCAYHLSDWGVCCNQESEHKADFTSDDDTCEKFEALEDEQD